MLRLFVSFVAAFAFVIGVVFACFLIPASAPTPQDLSHEFCTVYTVMESRANGMRVAVTYVNRSPNFQGTCHELN